MLRCRKRHADGDPVLGQALCAECYDYRAAVLFNASVSELWRRTAIYALRALGNLAGLSVRTVAKRFRLSYVKVVEFQRRGSVHLHALVRLDVRGDEHGRAPEALSADLLAAALELAARRVSAPCVGSADDNRARVQWGKELDVVIVTDANLGRRRAAAYLAKYSTKSTEDLGVLDHRLRAGVPESLELPGHLRNLVEMAWRLGGEPERRELRLRAWAHSAGYRGHFLTKSRRFSTTFRELRAIRKQWQLDQKLAGDHSKPREFPEGDGVVSEWSFVGMGYTTTGDAWLAESVAEDERFARRCVWEEGRDALEDVA
jgi:hypothetical protein